MNPIATTPRDDAQTAEDRLLTEAADWLVQMMSRDTTRDDAARLAEWRARSAAHDAAFQEVMGVRDYALVGKTTRKPLDRRAILAGGGGLAVACVASILRPPLGLWPSYAEFTADHRTPVGGRLAITPVAGVDVELSSRTAISTIDGGRGISMISGQAYVATRQANRPFRVKAGDLTVLARGAVFNIQALTSHRRVACLNGRIHCHFAGRVLPLEAGQMLSVEPNGDLRRAQIDIRTAGAWRRGLLIFEHAPLREVIDEINLYRPGRIVVRDAMLAAAPLSAIFHLDQIDNAIPQLEQLLSARARDLGAGVVLLG